ncbi:hypothetical protein Tsubulata_041946 [Turnera subulata]|uniref:Uncharacterized protein n=1 Tax=Turnera subulata TaxID=218843 RepID=A0A9Q0JBB2_9ROSI|nr:hypothetical protein Tsubulata_041946 [Turnera subulata]
MPIPSHSRFFFLCMLTSLSTTDGTELILVAFIFQAAKKQPCKSLTSGQAESGPAKAATSTTTQAEALDKLETALDFLHCRGIGGVPPATLVEMTLGTSYSALHYYDVSLVDGFNVPVSMTPLGGGGADAESPPARLI